MNNGQGMAKTPASNYPHYWKAADDNPSGSPAGKFNLCIDNECKHFGITMGQERYNVLTPPGGLHNAMIGALAQNGLHKYAFVNTGSSYPRLPYGAGFIDASHSYVEIVENIGPWVEMIELRNGAPAIFQFHDMRTLPNCQKLFRLI